MSIVIVAEKASQAERYAKALHISTKHKGYYQGVWNGKETYITHALGHLIEISEPAKQNPDWKDWKIETLPMIPEGKFKINLIQGKQHQYLVIKELLEKATLVINGTDTGREGELIFGYIYNSIGAKTPVKRLWAKDQTDKGILDAFQNLKNGADYLNMFMEAKARSESDWLIGMNGTRAISIASMQQFSVGRVQTPTLALICERYLQFVNFQSKPYWDVYINFPHQQFNIQASYGQSFNVKAEAEALKAKIEPTTICKAIEKKEKTVKPPLPFSLAELQKECNRKFHLSLSETLAIAQSLYETHQLTSYPRTDSAYITENTYQELPQVMNSLSSGSYGYLIKLLPEKYSKNCVDDKKVTDHYAIIPTEKNDTGVNLSENERKVYSLIVKRTIEALMPDCVKDITYYTFENAKEDFFAKGTVIRVKGWKIVNEMFNQKKNELDDEDDDKELILPVINQFQTFQSTTGKLEEKKTQPKPIHTGGSLVTAMEHCSNEVNDDVEAKKALKESEGIGRPATRDSIVDALLDKGLIEVKNKIKLYPTDKGMQLYHAIKEHPIASPKLTGQWETKLKKIEEGSFTYEEFMQEIKSYTKQISKELFEIGKTIQKEVRKIGVCPKCKNNQITSSVCEGKNYFYCEKIKEEICDFKISKEIKGVFIPEQEIANLLIHRKTSIIKGFNFLTQDQKPYKASKILVLDDLNNVKFANPPEETVPMACPKCRKTSLINQEKRIICKDSSCNYTLYKSFWDVNLSEKTLEKLLKGEKVLVKGFKSKEKKPYDLYLYLDMEGKIAKEFPQKQK